MQLQKQPFWRAFRKRCSENMLQISRRTPMLKFKQSNFIEIILQHGCFSVNLLHIFRTSFLKDTSGGLLLQLKSKKVTNLHFSQTKENLHLSLMDNGHLPVLSNKEIGFLKNFSPLQLGFIHTKKITNLHFVSLQKSKQNFIYVNRIFGSKTHSYIWFLIQIDSLFLQN